MKNEKFACYLKSYMDVMLFWIVNFWILYKLHLAFWCEIIHKDEHTLHNGEII